MSASPTTSENPEKSRQPGWFKKTRERIRYLATQFSVGRWEELTRWELWSIYPILLVVQVFRELLRDRGLVRASALAFVTTLSIVPMLTVVTSILTAFHIEESTLTQVLGNLIPVSSDQIIPFLQQLTQRQSRALGSIGFVILIGLGVMLFNNIEHAFNDIWRIRKRRPLVNKFITFYTIITVAPVGLAASVAQTAQIHVESEQISFFASFFQQLLPLVLAWATFTIANKVLPYTEVRLRAALVSGLVTAVAFEAAKYGFNIYIHVFVLPTYASVYGSIALIPIFLIWVYVFWIIVLFGAEMTHTIQNLRSLLGTGRLRSLNTSKISPFNPLIGLEIMTPIVMAFKHGEGPISAMRIAAVAGIPLELTRKALDKLHEHQLILELESSERDEGHQSYLPARPLSDISLIEIAEACRVNLTKHEHSPTLQSLIRMHASNEREIFAGMTCATLVEDSDQGRVRLLASTLAQTGGRHAAGLPALLTPEGTPPPKTESIPTTTEPKSEERADQIRQHILARVTVPGALPAIPPPIATDNQENALNTANLAPKPSELFDQLAAPALLKKESKPDPQHSTKSTQPKEPKPRDKPTASSEKDPYALLPDET